MSMQPDPSPGPLITPTPVVEARPLQVQEVPPAPVVVAPAAQQSVTTTSTRRYAFDSVIVGAIGVALIILGAIVVAKAGFDGSMEEPVVKVLGFTHTATLGLVEAGIGLCLLISALAASRAGAIFFGLVLGIGAIVGAVQTESFDDSLALQSGLAWLLAAAAAVVVLVSLLVPRLSTKTRTARVEPI